MLSKSFRAAAAAFVLGTAALAVGTLSLTVTAEAAARPAVARLLQDAIRQAGAGNLGAARASVGSAEAVSGLTSGDHAAIDQVKQYIAAKSGSAGGGGCAGLYLKGDYRGVIASGGGDPQCTQLKAQAYYLTRDFAGCVRFIRNNFGGGAGENTLVMLQRCAYEIQDNESQRTALEQLVQRTNKPEYWSQLLDTAANTKGLSDHGTLDVYRLKLLTNSLKSAEDYSLLAQLALQLGFAAESQNAVQKGLDAKIIPPSDRTTRLMNMAKGQAAANAAKQAGLIAGGNGDTLVKLGEDAWGQGRAADALKLIQDGIKKGVTDKSNAQIRLGMALLGTGQKDQAARAFAAVDDPKQKVIAHVWEIYARTH